MRWIIRRALFVATTLLLLYTAPLCVLASDGRENPYDVVVSFRLELILVLVGIMAAWWVVWMANLEFFARKLNADPGGDK
ncbi:hypothetical protein [Amycolatopsis sp. NPDC003731]